MAGQPGATAGRLGPEVGGRAAGVGGAAAPGGGGNRAPAPSSGPTRPGMTRGSPGAGPEGGVCPAVRSVGDSALGNGAGGTAEVKGQQGEGSAERFSAQPLPLPGPT
ncbi:circumsporozoite protein-like [Coturnix japonica]|uniref:circumsporozoite protein-like n=1 Tax=Coturnix japonica TaxID=93934 RepID=UPI000777AC03|nr:circumsporozoite protein-like [Coturnix japonica]